MKPRWTSASYLLYLGGLTVLVAAVYSLGYLASSYRDAAFTAWALLVLVVLGALAAMFRRSGRWTAAGLFAFATVIAFAAFVGALETWFGWLGGGSASFVAGLHVSKLLLVLLTLVAAVVALGMFRFPLISMLVAVLGWYFVTDVLSNGGNWTATVTLFVGLFYLAVASALDHGSRRPYGFWLHVTAGLLVGGSLLYFWHSGDTGWTLVAVVGLVYIGVAALNGRSSWTVLGSFGIYASAVHFGQKWARATISLFGGSATSQREWVPPIVLAAVGFLFVLLGLWLERRRRDEAPPLPAA